MGEEGEFKKRFGALFYDNLTGKVHPSKDFFNVIDEARKEFPIRGYRMELAEMSLIHETTHLEFDRPTPNEFLQVLRWFLKYFGDMIPKE